MDARDRSARGIARSSALAAAGLGLLVILAAPAGAELLAPSRAPPLPEFTQDASDAWLNSAPLRVADLRGRVVLLEFWTFDCVNCRRSIPWLHAIEQRYAQDGLRLVGIHTPELPQERVRANVVAKLRELGVGHPVMLDADFAYWNALGNRYWPAFYLVDRAGRVRAVFVGETHAGDARAVGMERAIISLLAEGPASAASAAGPDGAARAVLSASTR